jgi:hypothetical protein
MQSRIFEAGKVEGKTEVKPQLKQVVQRNSEMGAILCYNDGGRAEMLAVKPTMNRINKSDLQQRKELSETSKVYNARRNQSAILFS